VDPQELRTTKESCEGKERYYDYNVASSVLGNLRKPRFSIYKEGYVYECNICHWFHITTNIKNYQKNIIIKKRRKVTKKTG